MDGNRKVLVSIVVCVILILIISCTGRATYIYEGINYDSPEPALNAQRKDIDSTLSRITPTKNPVGGAAVVIFPSQAWVKNHYFVRKGPVVNIEQFKQLRKQLFDIIHSGQTLMELEPVSTGFVQKEKSKNFVAATVINAWHAMGEAIERRRIFDKVVINPSDDPEHTVFNEDFAIILLKKDEKVQWLLKRKKDKPPKPITIQEISGALPPAQRTIVWLDNVEKAAIGQ